ncbi:MAG: glycoside hydrolase family 13 protein [Pseudomonadota bacterium]
MTKRAIALLMALTAVHCRIGLAEPLPVERIEPPHWYRGYTETETQVLFYGTGIGSASVTVSGKGVALLRTVSVPNPNYLFVYIDVAADGDNSVQFTLTRNGDSETFPYELMQRRSEPRLGFNSTDAIYLVMPDRFANGDPSNDRVPGYPEGVDRTNPDGRHGGDIQGVIDKLDYIADLGFTQLWLNPVLENRMSQGSYHGYATTDFYRVDPRFGSNTLYQQLSRDAAAHGIGLIKDVIVNHIGTEHWWMDDLPTPDWINSTDRYTETTHARTALQDPYAAPADIAAMADGWFVPTMADLNQRQPLLGDYLVQNALWWIEFANLSGIRVDTYPYPDKHYMATWTRRLMSEYPRFSIVGEEWSLNPVVVSYWQRGKQNFDGYVSDLTSVMDFPLQDALISALTMPEPEYGSVWTPLYEMLANDHLYAKPMDLVIFGDNHDMDRLLTQLGADPRRLQMALAILASMRGIPQVFYGTEVLATNPGTHSHGVLRSDFPGGWPDDDKNWFKTEGPDDVKAIRKTLRRLLQWRKNATVIHNGALQHYTPEPTTYAYVRFDTDRAVLIVANRSEASVAVALDRFRDRIGAATQGYDVLADRTIELTDHLEVAAMAVRVIDIDRSP